MGKTRLFCLPYAGGSSLFYRDLGSYLKPGIELCAIDLAGHGMRMGEALNETMDQDLSMKIMTIDGVIKPMITTERSYVYLFSDFFNGLA